MWNIIFLKIGVVIEVVIKNRFKVKLFCLFKVIGKMGLLLFWFCYNCWLIRDIKMIIGKVKK